MTIFLGLFSTCDLWYLRHWLQYWKLRTWFHDNLCYLTINCDTGQHSQFLLCLRTKYGLLHWSCSSTYSVMNIPSHTIISHDISYISDLVKIARKSQETQHLWMLEYIGEFLDALNAQVHKRPKVAPTTGLKGPPNKPNVPDVLSSQLLSSIWPHWYQCMLPVNRLNAHRLLWGQKCA